MSDIVIKATNLTKDYGLGRGIFNMNFEIKKGEMIGFVGSNGAGKTTTIRHIMGFLKPTSGSMTVNGLEAHEHEAEIAKLIGYVPGEIAFPDLKTGISFLKNQAELTGLKNFDKANELIKKLALDPKASLKRMSKGMKQKTALVAALMNDPEIIILDEPTTGLDPLMRDQFLSIIKEEHKKGKTIFMSTHLYEEVEATCDKVALIDKGHIIDMVELSEISSPDIQIFEVVFINADEMDKALKNSAFEVKKARKANSLKFKVPRKNASEFIRFLSSFKLKALIEEHDTLQNYFSKKFKERGYETK